MSRIRSVAVVFLFLCALSAFAFQSAPPPGGQGGQGRGRAPMKVEDQSKKLRSRSNLTAARQAKSKPFLGKAAGRWKKGARTIPRPKKAKRRRAPCITIH